MPMCLLCFPNLLLNVLFNLHVKLLRWILPSCIAFVENCTCKHLIELGYPPSQRRNASKSTLIYILCNLLKLVNYTRCKPGHIPVPLPRGNGPGRSRRFTRGCVHCIMTTHQVRVDVVLAAEKTSKAPRGHNGPLGQAHQIHCQEQSPCILISLQNLARTNRAK